MFVLDRPFKAYVREYFLRETGLNSRLHTETLTRQQQHGAGTNKKIYAAASRFISHFERNGDRFFLWSCIQTANI